MGKHRVMTQNNYSQSSTLAIATSRPSFWARLRGRNVEQAMAAAAADRLYRSLMGQARSPAFYLELGVPDTPEGRFELLALHVALTVRRLGEPGRATAQALFDLMCADLDVNLRELGVGDLSVGKEVKRLAQQFFARLEALDRSLGGEAAALEPMLLRNVYNGGAAPSAGQVAALAIYLEAAARDLAGQDQAVLGAGQIALAGLQSGLAAAVSPARLSG